MTTLDALLSAIPEDPMAAFVLADYLEDQGDQRGELLRLAYTLTRSIEVPDRPRLEERMRALIEAGVRPIGPYRSIPLSGVKRGFLGFRKVIVDASLTFAWVPPGTFLMGSPEDTDFACQHRVILTRGFWLGIHPVSCTQWEAVYCSSPREFREDLRPSTWPATWSPHEIGGPFEDLRLLLGRMTRNMFRLPTEAEWEYACRAGTTTSFHFGETLSADQACFNTSETKPVGSYPPNAWGLYDMHGNVLEWCQDRFAAYRPEDAIDPKGPLGPDAPEGGVLRGGCWYYQAWMCSSASRQMELPDSVFYDGACRLILC
jgi:formylglycine-generating enzyme required for sulfatase activity